MTTRRMPIGLRSRGCSVWLRARPRVTHRRGVARGFTLIEMMIAMLLGLIVIAGVISVFLASQQSYRSNNALADVEDGSRVAFELMARDIRQAGLTGCNSVNGRVVNVLNTAPGNAKAPSTPTAQTWWTDWGNAVHGYGPNSSDGPDPALVGLSAAQVAGTDSLQLIGAGDSDVTIQSSVPGVNFKLNTPTTQLQTGDVIMVCSPDHAAILQISSYNSSNETVVYNTGAKVSPGNCSSNLAYPNTACSGNSTDSCMTPSDCFPPPNSIVAQLTASDWYIGTNPDGGRSLYRVSLQNAGGTMKATSQEMVRNVTDMHITYLDPSDGAIGNQFVPAATITTDNGWAGVTAVHVALTLQSTFQRASVNGNKPIVRTYAFTTTLRNRVP
ncbi:MAG TPA: PilW family protein [Rhodanobacteraceae bacterium]